MCWAKGQEMPSTGIGMLVISFGTFATFPLDGWCLGGLSLWTLLESVNLKRRPPLSLSWLGPTRLKGLLA